MIEPGQIVGGKFRVEHVLGKGGMGVVLVATHLQLDQRVALKVLHDDLANDPATVERFMREARAAGKLRSDHVCHVTDVGKAESGTPYIVMELLDGEDLAHLVSRGSLDVQTAADLVLQACVGLAEAHALGIVHRDIKPSNLFLARRVGGAPIVKVLDFGIAKAPNLTDMVVTKTTAVMGSPGYMSPEQLRSTREADARSDIWSLGILLYEMVARRLPFEGETITDLAVHVSIDAPAPLDVDPAYKAIVDRCLQKEPDRRYASIAELARDLAKLASPASRPLADHIAHIAPPVRRSAPVVVLGDAATAVDSISAAPTPPIYKPIVPNPPPPMPYADTIGALATSGATTPEPATRRTGLLIGVGLAIAGVAIVATYALVNRPTPAQAPAASPETQKLMHEKVIKHSVDEHLLRLKYYFDQVAPDSPFRADAEQIYARAKERVLADATRLARDGKCDDLDKLEREQPDDLLASLKPITCSR